MTEIMRRGAALDRYGRAELRDIGRQREIELELSDARAEVAARKVDNLAFVHDRVMVRMAAMSYVRAQAEALAPEEAPMMATVAAAFASGFVGIAQEMTR